MKYLYHACRVVFGAWFLFSGLMHFFWPWMQPLGWQQPAIDFTLALIASGLFAWVKVIEVVLGVAMLANRLMPLTIVALIPINVVICYWNIVLDAGPIDYAFGIATIFFNAVLAWMWRTYFWQLFTWKGVPDYSLDPHLPRPPPPVG